MKKWEYAPIESGAVEKIKRDFSVSSLLAKALVSLGLFSEEEISEFCEPKKTDYDPFIIPDMEKGLMRINDAIDRGEKIAVYGDYDADGVTATAVLYTYLEGMGADVTYYIPNRLSEGYGMNNAAIDRLFSEGVTLIVTVDNGISATEEVEYAKTLGIDTVITDHHKLSGEMPSAVAVINPQRQDCPEFKELSGVGVAFMLVAANEGDIETALEYYSDLVAIGTTADVVPMKGINRLFLRRGAESIKYGSNAGIAALLSESGREIDSAAISFGIVPKINASGRMGDAEKALRLLLSEDEEQAAYLAEAVNLDNHRRQEIEAEILKEAAEIIERENLLKYPVIIVSKENWHQGVLGIVAAKISELYERPAIIFSEEADEAIGSGRSFGDFSLFEALKECKKYLVRFGGHKLAAGLTIKTENISILREKISEIYKASSDISLPPLNVSAKVAFSELTCAAVEELEYLKPFGSENPQPIFVLENVFLENIYPIGEGKHTRFKLSSGNDSIYAVAFGRTKESFGLEIGSRVSVALTVEMSFYQGKKTLSFKVCDIKPVFFDDEEYLRSLYFSEKVRNKNDFTREEKEEFFPSRNDLVSVYSYLSKRGYIGKTEHLAFILPLSYGKIYTAITAFSELGLITTYKKGNNIAIKVNETDKKVDIMSASVLKRFGKGE